MLLRFHDDDAKAARFSSKRVPYVYLHRFDRSHASRATVYNITIPTQRWPWHEN